jgi:mannose-1-phosphate guanylyltransferase
LKDSIAPLHAVILAGGAGERFWPASRSSVPKPFLRVVGDQTLLDGTLDRARHFAAEDRIWIVCGEEHARDVRKASGLPASRVLVEPMRRNTAMAAAWAAHRIAEVDPEAVLAVLAADHHVPDVAAFARDIRLAARAAHDAGALVTLGVVPTRPETGYGYIQTGARVSDFPRIREVKRFVEKPDLRTAKRYLQSDAYRWNAGIFIWSASSLLREIEQVCPELHHALEPLHKPAATRRKRAGQTRGRSSARERVEAAYRRAPSLPIDIAVMERSDRVYTLPVDFVWSDVGTWASLAEQVGVGGRRGRGSAERAGNRVIGGDAILESAQDNLVWAGGGRLVALLGVEDLVVVDTEDVILVTKRDAGSDVKRLIQRVRKSGREDLT